MTVTKGGISTIFGEWEIEVADENNGSHYGAITYDTDWEDCDSTIEWV
jgi:hypothetical protein